MHLKQLPLLRSQSAFSVLMLMALSLPPHLSFDKNPRCKQTGYFYFLVRFRLRGKAARTATQGERSPAPLENPQAKSPTRQAAGKSSHYKKMIDELRNQLKQDD